MKGFFDYLKKQLAYKNVDLNAMSIGKILNPLSKEDLIEYLETFKGHEDTYQARKIASLKSFFRYCYENGMIEVNKAALIKSIKPNDKEIKILKLSDVDRLIKATELPQKNQHLTLLAQRDKTIISLLASTGIRVSELVGLDVGDIDFIDSSMVVTRKGGNQEELYLPQTMENLLYEYINDTRSQILGQNKTPALFVGQNLERIKPRNIETMLKKYKEIAGIKDVEVTPHALRRTCGTYLYNETRDIYAVAKQLGHKCIDTTRKHYAKANDNVKRETAKTLEGILK